MLCHVAASASAFKDDDSDYLQASISGMEESYQNFYKRLNSMD
jgi:hypothetical protein